MRHNYFDKLPTLAFKQNERDGQFSDTDAPVVAFKRGETGYYPVTTRLTADELNKLEGVTKAQAEAMYMGSLFGWHVHAADPDNYDEEGKLCVPKS